MAYPEPKDIRTGKAKKHQAASQQGNKKLQPVNGKIFTYETIELAKEELMSGLKFPVVGVNHSILGGEEHVSIFVGISIDPEETWYNGIYENSRYAQIHIENEGVTHQIAGTKLKMRKFKGQSIAHVVEKINAIKETNL